MSMLIEILKKGLAASIGGILLFSLIMKIIEHSQSFNNQESGKSYLNLNEMTPPTLGKGQSYFNMKPTPELHKEIPVKVQEPEPVHGYAKINGKSMRVSAPNTNYIEINGKRKYFDEM